MFETWIRLNRRADSHPAFQPRFGMAERRLAVGRHLDAAAVADTVCSVLHGS